MEFNKKMNLLPQSYKNKHANKYLLLFFGGISTVLLLILMTSIINLTLVNQNIKKLLAQDKEYQSKQSTIIALQESINKKQKLIEEHEKDKFPFNSFISSITAQKPAALTIISIDSADRLIALENENTTENKKDDEDTESHTTLPQKQVTYEKDLSGEKLIVRGYSKSSSAIASFVSSLSRLFYVAEAKLTAIEEHPVSGVNNKIFEMELLLK